MSAQTETAGLAAAARTAGFAPSIHNTQPWRWRVSGPTLELWAVRDRQLAVVDPEGRMLAVSCGAALHHPRVALAAVDDPHPQARHGIRLRAGLCGRRPLR
jgi:hypothetical protein